MSNISLSERAHTNREAVNMTLEEAYRYFEEDVTAAEGFIHYPLSRQERKAALVAIDCLVLAYENEGRWDGEGDGYAENENGEMTIVYDTWKCSKCGHEIEEDDIKMLPKFCSECGNDKRKWLLDLEFSEEESV